jgi:magnesium transporter
LVFFADAYLSALLRYGVYDAEGRYLGRLDDVLVTPHDRFPEVIRIAVRPKDAPELLYVPWSAVRTASQEGIRIVPGFQPGTAAAPAEDEIHLRRDLLDKQIVDVSGKRVVRVHDLKLGAVANRVLLTHADIGPRGILRRLGWEHFVLGLCRPLRIPLPERLIAWEHLQTPPPGGELHADRTRDLLRRIHPADLADIAEELSAPERAAFLGSMDEEVAADAMQEMETEALVAVVNEFSDEQASDLIEEMDPDAGADLLAELPEERANALLDLMEPEEAADLRMLLSYPDDSAGGLMTSEQITVPIGLTAQQALDAVRGEASEVDTAYYVYLLDDDQRLAGALSLWELIVADPTEPVGSVKSHEVVSVTPDTAQVDVARLAARYNLLAIPVVDEDGRLLGIVTADDAIDAVIPTSWKKRIPKAFAS